MKIIAKLIMVMMASLFVLSHTNAAAKIEGEDGKWISFGVGVRASYSSVEDGSSSGDSWSNDFDIDNARIYVNGQISDMIGFELNTECIFCSGDNEKYRILDAIAKFSFTPAFNIWAGRLLVPADRAEMSGPFYANVYDGFKTPFFPADQSGTHGNGGAGVYGRDEGVVFWGGLGEEARFTYAIGIFEGLEGGSNSDDHLLYSGRFSYNFLNVEKNPGYYTSSTYYGNAGDVFTVALAIQYQKDATGTVADDGDFSAYALDVLYETVLQNGGVATFEAEYKDFDTDGKTGGLNLFDGEAYTATALYLFPNKLGIGKVQPYLRYSDLDANNGNDSDEKEIGVNYIINGHNTRLSMVYQMNDVDGGKDRDTFKIGLQYQY